jgi:hypothetical protein
MSSQRTDDRQSSAIQMAAMALMYNSPWVATVIAVTNGILWALDRDTFQRIIVTANKRRSKESYANDTIGFVSRATNSAI